MPNLPPTLLQAVSADGGGQLAIVIGAGCSHESPTSIPLSKQLASEASRKLILDHVLTSEECTHPEDLAYLASLVFEKTGSQVALVARLPMDRLKMAKPNRGHLLLIALMAERAISYVVSLNFDLAVQNASSQLGVVVHVVDNGAAPVPASPTIVYLHGSASGAPEELVLRTEQLTVEWKNSWTEVVAQQVLAAPNLLFSGLGSAAPVLTETMDMIANAAAEGRTFFQADVMPRNSNTLATQLGVTDDRYIQKSWGHVMECLSHRVVEEQVHKLIGAGKRDLNNCISALRWLSAGLA